MRSDEQFALMALSERLDKVLLEFREELKKLDADLDNKFGLAMTLAQFEGIASYARKKKANIADNQP